MKEKTVTVRSWEQFNKWLERGYDISIIDLQSLKKTGKMFPAKVQVRKKSGTKQ